MLMAMGTDMNGGVDARGGARCQLISLLKLLMTLLPKHVMADEY